MNGQILIIGPRYFNFLDAVENAFIDLGWETAVESYDNPIHPYTTSMKLRYRFSMHKDRMQDRSRMEYNRYIMSKYERLQPDAVFIMNGDILFDRTLDYFRIHSKVALWMFDSRTKLPSSTGLIDHTDAMFCFEKDDVDWFATQGKKAYFLPQACDAGTYRPLGLVRDIDILFIGNLFYSPRRQQTMNAVIERFKDRKILVCGMYRPWFKNFFKWLFMRHRNIFTNRNVSPEEANRLYNRAKVVLNIHQEHQKNGANPRTFEICGSGAYQLCDANPYIESLFDSSEIGIWHDSGELFSLIEEGLDKDMGAAAETARRKVMTNHTFEIRMREVLTLLFQERIE